MTSPGFLYVDGDPDGAYAPVIAGLPANWSVHVRPPRGGLGNAMRWFFERFPDQPYYGWLADDLRPRSPGWDLHLARAAGRDGFACCNDGWMVLDPETKLRIMQGRDMCGALCWGGDLVRAAGWWMPPFLRHDHVSADTAWCILLSQAPRFRYLDDVLVEHLNWRSGKRERDATDRLCARSETLLRQDMAALRNWAQSAATLSLIERLNREEAA